jgi:menaquinol-cytochrome c reductase iron-sulfur subunit
MEYMSNIAQREEGRETTRRSFFVGGIYGLWAIIAAALGLPAFFYLLFPPKAKKNEDWIDLGDIAQLAADSPVEMAFRRNRVDGWRVISEKSTAWVVKHVDNSVVAFGPQCTHLGCAYHWEEAKNEFFCPCHSSLFAMDGKVISGPALRPLDRYDTRVEGTKLLLGKLRQAGEPRA